MHCAVVRLLSFFMVISLLCGCSSKSDNPRADNSNVLTISVREDPQTLDPRKMRDVGTRNLAHIFYEGLTRFNLQGVIELAAAQKIEASPDRLTHTITLKDVSWSDGSPLTAGDFAETWKSTLQSDFDAPNAYQLYVIDGAREAKEGKASVDTIGITVVDPKTLVVKLKEPVPYFWELLSSPFFYPVHKSLREGIVQGLPISNGPFKMVDSRERQGYIFAKNGEYWDAASVKLDGVDVKVLSESTALHMFQAGQLDWAGSPISTLPQDAVLPLKDAGKLLVAPSAATHWFRFNTKKGPFAHQQLRQVFARALDRQSLVDNVTQGNQLPALLVVPPVMSLENKPSFQDNDVDGARNLLATVRSAGGVPPVVTLSYAASDRGHKIAQAVQQQWETALGIKVKLEANEFRALFEKLKNGEYEVAYGSWYADFMDPVNFLEIFQRSTNPTNGTFWESEEYQRLLDAAASESVPEKRLQLLSKAEGILLQEWPVAPLMYPTYNYLKNERLQGVYFSPLGYVDFRQAYFSAPKE